MQKYFDIFSEQVFWLQIDFKLNAQRESQEAM